ncbi:MAG: TonB-dependent receptor [Sphingomonadales bacterium]|nr:TonB-dependent receptor [Sphingomonadales bacterium]NCO49501.1 TonB-dependent receptor [Sphingomonadales bacterium]NCO99025.1 TonB-dependent receptor [Sphingomonadales bacterium]NCP26598.1 TonB-dependent receptor [Sphingomonadales bacterium]NCP50002.1 TonB-dependent receptor [Sphingomonadales bacterium]
MKTSMLALAAGTLFVAHSPAVFAEELASEAPTTGEQANPKKPDTSFSVGEIVVTARGMAGSTDNVLTSVDRLGGDVAQDADVDNIYELIGQMPGILLTDFNQGTTSGKFSMRGFNGEGNINAVKLLIDGIPSNSNDGNMPYIDMIFPLNIAGIEVVRGTSDPRYGLHAIAGSANILTRSGGTFVDARASVGSYNTYEGQLVAGLERGNLSQNYQIAYRSSDGYRDHGDTHRFSLSGKWGLTLGEDVKLGAIARYYDADAEEPGYLTFADSRANPRMTNAYNVSDGDTRKMQQYAVTADATLSDDLDWSSMAYYNRLRDDRYVKFSAGASQQRRLTREDHYGVSSAMHWHSAISGVPFMLEAGGNIEWQDNRSARWLAVERVPTSQTRDQQFDLSVGGVYVQANIEPADWLRITPAYRIDWVGGNFSNLLNNTVAPINDYGSIDQQKLSVAIFPTDGVTLYGNWGKTFQIGLGSGAYLIPPRQVDLAPSINTGWELGAKYQLGDTVEGRVAYWQQSATGEIARKLNDPAGDFENVGGTDREGIDIQLRVTPMAKLSLWGALSWQKAVISVPSPATPQLAGNELNHTPRWLWSGGIEYTPVEPLTLSLTGRGQSSYYLTTANAEGKWGDLALFDASVAWQVNETLEFGLAVKNLGDSYYEYVWWDGVQTLHSPANGRNITASARLRF